jgi:hypothetical protein
MEHDNARLNARIDVLESVLMLFAKRDPELLREVQQHLYEEWQFAQRKANQPTQGSGFPRTVPAQYKAPRNTISEHALAQAFEDLCRKFDKA